MHGGREGEDRKRRRHMRPVPAPGTVTGAAAPTTSAIASEADSLQPASDSFLKDGRKIRVGNCALFQAGNAPPFIGIIRWFATNKEDLLKLCVSWLYRPSDVKLSKGISLEAAPNEVFYSFHKDVIPAASLLHPCKVAFLRKGVELPLGISSFVCRRVYDIENKCLWWLTDQDYINERQEEVDQLIDKTRVEMHAAVQSGGRSPKTLNGPASTQQLKSGSDSVQNSGGSFASQVKGKKRDRGDQGSEPIKREPSFKTDDGDSANFRIDSLIKAEIAKITEKGGLMNIEGVEKLVHLMQIDRPDRKSDLACRVLLADVIAATDRLDCLGRFVQLRGVPVLDDWLQEAHKGKSGDGCSPKESDKAVEELLLALLRALDKLPVNLNALQTCNIGKSVNHLRSHKNVEIQKKARSLVDTWKKRVDAEIKINDAKSVGSSQTVSWPGKPGFPEVSHAGNRLAMKSTITQPLACRSITGKPGFADAIVKSTPVIPGSLKLPPSLPVINSKVAEISGTSELSPMVSKEEKSSSSSQSPNNSQSCSSDHAKMLVSSWKEDARSSTAGSMNASKTSGGSSRQRRPNNGFLGTSLSGVQKETNMGKSVSISRTSTLDKVSQGGLTCERTAEVHIADHGNGHRLIVRLPNPGRNPVQIAAGGSFEDTSVTGSRASSPGACDKHDNNDGKLKAKDRSHIASDVNRGESCQSNAVKDGQVGSNEGDRPPAPIPDEEHIRIPDKTEKAGVAPLAICSSVGNENIGIQNQPTKRNSFSSMNALIESCANYSESGGALSAGDDLGMNLLASVAAGEMSKSELVSSPGSSPAMEDPAKSRLSCDASIAQSHGQSGENADVESDKQGKSVGSMLARDNLQEVGSGFSGHNEDNKSAGEQTGQHHGSGVNSRKIADSCVVSEGKLDEEGAGRFFPLNSPADTKDGVEFDGAFQHRKSSEQVVDSPKPEFGSLTIQENKFADCADCTSDFIGNSFGVALSGKPEKLVDSESPSCPLDNEVLGDTTSTEQHPSPVAERRDDDTGTSSIGDKFCSSGITDSKTKHLDSFRVVCHEQKEASSLPRSTGAVLASAVTTVEILEIREKRPDASAECGTSPAQKADNCTKSPRRDEKALVAATEEEMTTRLDFDLNEGIVGDDGNRSEPSASAAMLRSSAVHLATFVSNGSPAPITVVAPAKGPFFPRENLLKSKAEAGWKGSAATSAFRPAEPRNAKQGRAPLDIDLNVPDERVLEEMAAQKFGSGGLDLDLNMVDESTDNGRLLANGGHRVRPIPGGFPVGEANDFDLNNGPLLDEVSLEGLQRIPHARSVPFLPRGLRMNTREFGSVSPWLSYPAVAVPSFLPERGEHPYPAGAQRILGSVTGADIYRSPVLPSSPATAFQYGGYPFGSSFPVASATAYGDSPLAGGLCFPSQLHVASNYPRPYVFNLHDGGSENNRKSSRRGLDLNAGPGNMVDSEVRDEILSSTMRQLPVAGSKRKEPDGGRDADRFAYKQQSWQ